MEGVTPPTGDEQLLQPPCKHEFRDEVDFDHDITRCLRCAAILKDDDVIYTPTEEAPHTEERDFESEYYALRGEVQRLEESLKQCQLMEDLWQGTAEKLYIILETNMGKIRALKAHQVIPGQTTVDDMIPTRKVGEDLTHE